MCLIAEMACDFVLANLEISIGFLFLHVCTEHTDIRVTLV